MRKLTKEQLETRDTLQQQLEAKHAEMEAAINAYNSVVEEVDTWRDAIVSAIESYVENRSEKWQEGEKAQAYDEWKSSFEDIDCDPIEVPEALSLADCEEEVGS